MTPPSRTLPSAPLCKSALHRGLFFRRWRRSLCRRRGSTLQLNQDGVDWLIAEILRIVYSRRFPRRDVGFQLALLDFAIRRCEPHAAVGQRNDDQVWVRDRKSTRLNSSHGYIS